MMPRTRSVDRLFGRKVRTVLAFGILEVPAVRWILSTKIMRRLGKTISDTP